MSSAFAIEEQTAEYLAEFASRPPRENQSLDDLRAGYKSDLIGSSPSPDGNVTWQPLSIARTDGQLEARLYQPAHAPDDGPLLLYVHGGGFAVGDLESHDGLMQLICSASGLRIMALDYRRAPEHPFPAARDDVLSAFQYIVGNAAALKVDAKRIALGGESAGAAHATAAALMLRNEPQAAAALWLMSPALDATLSGESYTIFAEGAGRTAAEFAYLWSLYAPDEASRSDAAVSPGLSDPAGAPPLFIYTAEYDPARSDGENFAAKAQAASVPAVLRRRSGLIHQYPEITGVSDASRQAVTDAAIELASFLNALDS